MAVRQSRKQITQPEINEEVESSSEKGKSFIAPRILQQREFQGALTAQRSNGLGNSGHSHVHNGGNSSATDIHESESLSEIDDAEVIGYLNTKHEMRYKRILWEAMDRGFSKAKKPKLKAELKRSTSVDKAAKATPKIEKKGRFMDCVYLVSYFAQVLRQTFNCFIEAEFQN
ncbi:uncharacterized protein [Coffea arabica]|uniref:Uncharacterized protein isoform X1 n=1 Tax=Coffea arabica TaxID=13443 RepID=A0A6P6TRC3_COFAR|nr:uncharacterized protein LOC113703114 isoform X1 [Coffea arabica]XP_027080171.1 uncharacterized protein LOC113703114 isoform X1 [Coffea arabica]